MTGSGVKVRSAARISDFTFLVLFSTQRRIHYVVSRIHIVGYLWKSYVSDSSPAANDNLRHVVSQING